MYTCSGWLLLEFLQKVLMVQGVADPDYAIVVGMGDSMLYLHLFWYSIVA